MKILNRLVVMVVLIGCQSKTETQKSEDVLAVENRLKNYYEVMSQRDWPVYRSFFWENATITTAWQAPGDSVERVDVTTIDDFIKETPNGPDSQPVFEKRMLDSKITVEGNIAEAWINYEAKFGQPDSLMQWNGTDVFTLLRHEGEWRIVSLVFESARED